MKRDLPYGYLIRLSTLEVVQCFAVIRASVGKDLGTVFGSVIGTDCNPLV